MRTAAEIRNEMYERLAARWECEHLGPLPYAEVVEAILSVVSEELARREELVSAMLKSFGLNEPQEVSDERRMVR